MTALVRLFALLLCAAFTTSPAAAAGMFSAFKGTYTGTSTLTGTEGVTVSGDAVGTFTIARRGSNGTLKLEAMYQIGNVRQYIAETFTFARKGKVITIDAIAPGVTPAGAKVPGVFVSRPKKQLFRATVPWTYHDRTGTDEVSVQLKKTTDGKQLLVSLIVNVDPDLPKYEVFNWTLKREK
jgi:hypothetical protein